MADADNDFMRRQLRGIDVTVRETNKHPATWLNIRRMAMAERESEGLATA